MQIVGFINCRSHGSSIIWSCDNFNVDLKGTLCERFGGGIILAQKMRLLALKEEYYRPKIRLILG